LIEVEFTAGREVLADSLTACWRNEKTSDL